MNDRPIRISEIYGIRIQGEGPLAGRPTVFVRTGGCDDRCRWCDTPHAVLPTYRSQWQSIRPVDVAARVDELAGAKPILVTLTGGNPATQPLGPLITCGRSRGHSFALETQGSVAKPWFADLDWLILSPKPPSAGLVTGWDTVEACLQAAQAKPRCVLKVVVFDDADYQYARSAAAQFPRVPMFLQPGNPDPNAAADETIRHVMGRFRWLADKVASNRWFDVTVLPQLHVLAWGNERGF